MGRSLLQSATIVLALVLPFGSAAPRGLHKARVIKEPGELEESYDYVIVGAGTAGLTIADRLTEDEDVTVLVVEYGLLSAFSLPLETGPTEGGDDYNWLTRLI